MSSLITIGDEKESAEDPTIEGTIQLYFPMSLPVRGARSADHMQKVVWTQIHWDETPYAFYRTKFCSQYGVAINHVPESLTDMLLGQRATGDPDYGQLLKISSRPQQAWRKGQCRLVHCGMHS
jgi:hypothetical protein